MGITLRTFLSHLEKEELWQVAFEKETGTKSTKRFETVTQSPQIALHRALQSLSLWKHILIV